MANLTVKWDDESRVARFNNFLAGTMPRAKAGLIWAGLEVKRRQMLLLSGTRTPSNPYPAVGMGTYRASIESTPSADGMINSIGATVRYDRIQQLGGRIAVTDRMRRVLHWKGIHLKATTSFITIPARPTSVPAWKKSRAKVIDIMRKAVSGKT